MNGDDIRVIAYPSTFRDNYDAGDYVIEVRIQLRHFRNCDAREYINHIDNGLEKLYKEGHIPVLCKYVRLPEWYGKSTEDKNFIYEIILNSGISHGITGFTEKQLMCLRKRI